jgi:magnesium-transporting ATPase (P-type)
MMNAKAGRFKMSRIEKKMNNLVIYILICQTLLSLIISFIGITWFKDYASEDTYLDITSSIGTNWVETFFTYFLLLNTLIPISLIVTIEVVKVL